MHLHEHAGIPNYISALVDHVKQRKLEWMELPGAPDAEREAQVTDRYDDVGYTTDYEQSDEEYSVSGSDDSDDFNENNTNDNEDYGIED